MRRACPASAARGAALHPSELAGCSPGQPRLLMPNPAFFHSLFFLQPAQHNKGPA